MRRFTLFAAILSLILPGCTSLSSSPPAPKGASSERRTINIGPEYVLGPEDLIEISVWKDESLTKELVIRPDGKISFPLIGEIQAGGVTAEQLQHEITRKIAEFVPDPTVTVLVLRVNSYKVFVVGKVNKPGEYITGTRTNVMQALSMAGGLGPFASPRKIVILRRENGVERKIPFNYNQVKKGKNLDQNIILKRGDVVVVP